MPPALSKQRARTPPFLPSIWSRQGLTPAPSDTHTALREQEATDAGAGAYFGAVEESAKSALYAFESMSVSFRSTCTSTRTVRRGQ